MASSDDEHTEDDNWCDLCGEDMDDCTCGQEPDDFREVYDFE